MNLKLIKYTNANALEASWFNRVITPAVGVEGEEGYRPEAVTDTPIRCHAYADTQIQMLRDDAAVMGTPLDDYEDLIAEVEAAIQPPLAPTPEEILAQRKAERQALVDAITVTTSTGHTFDGNEEAQSRMSRAIQAAQIASIPSTTWVLANNVPTVVTLAELQEALVLSMQAMGAVWAAPYEV
jgi:hypothetical protein